MSDFGLYIHIPFCAKKCLYCDFVSFPGRGASEMERYTEVLISEIRAKAAEYKEKTVSSIFLGGGTPSVLPASCTKSILDAVFECFNVRGDAEITTEANPGTVDSEKLSAYKASGINRISFGLQSTVNEELKKLGRIHTYEDFLRSYDMAKNAGFDNINIDIMSALPGQSIESYEETLRRVVGLNPAHISAYSLIIEEGTPFYDMYAGGAGLPSEDADREMYALTKRVLSEAGYKRYEISNYAKEGLECRHNCLYWERGEYLGLGLNASSFSGNVRWKNETDLNKYLEGRFLTRFEEEVLTRKDALSETMFLGLREMRGILETPEITAAYGKILDRQEKAGLILRKDGKIALTDKGIDVSNMVFSDYIF